MTEENSGAKENGQGKQGKTWYPYITKSQFEKFILRLESKTPDLIDRDYVRAIIRTPSMIHRFLRGIQAMQLIDRDQRPTERLQRLAAQKDRKSAMAEILQDLYPELLEKWQGSNGSMADGEIVDFFRQQTDMGKDSANKMKMFFKYLLTEADFSELDTKSAAPQPAAEPVRESRHSRVQAPAGKAPSNTPKSLSEAQKAYLDAVQKIVRINVDGDWDEDMIRVAFDRLERLIDRIKRS
jgi:hypothetical protein